MVHPNPEQDEKTQRVTKRHSQVSTASRSTALDSESLYLEKLLEETTGFKKWVQPELSKTRCAEEWVCALLTFNRWV